MPEEATLDAFAVDDEDDSSDGDAADADAAAAEREESTAPAERGDSAGEEHENSSAAERDDAATVDPAAVTSSWGDGGTCAACGESASRLWGDADERVCTACKSWA